MEDPTFIFGDNQSLLANTTMPKSMLKKNTQIIAYHFVREGCVRDEWRTAYISTHENVADILTKPLPSGEKRWKFVRMLLHHFSPHGVWWGDTNIRPECTVQGRTNFIPLLAERKFRRDSVAVFFFFSFSFYHKVGLLELVMACTKESNCK